MAIQQQTELSVTEALMQKADLNAKLRAGDDVDVKAAQQAANATYEAMDEFDKTISKDPITKRTSELASAEQALKKKLKLNAYSDTQAIALLAQEEKKEKEATEAKKAKEAAQKKAQEEQAKKMAAELEKKNKE